jgi:hypothetical protein
MSKNKNAECVINDEDVCTAHGQIAEDCVKDQRESDITVSMQLYEDIQAPGCDLTLEDFDTTLNVTGSVRHHVDYAGVCLDHGQLYAECEKEQIHG